MSEYQDSDTPGDPGEPSIIEATTIVIRNKAGEPAMLLSTNDGGLPYIAMLDRLGNACVLLEVRDNRFEAANGEGEVEGVSPQLVLRSSGEQMLLSGAGLWVENEFGCTVVDTFAEQLHRC